MNKFLAIITLAYRRVKIILQKKVIAQCGHPTKLMDRVNAFGETGIITITPGKNGKVEYCHRCLEKMTIRCAWCGNPIFIGNPVTLYTPAENYKIPEHAVICGSNPIRLVGCLGWNCADSGVDRAGFWIPPGKVHRVASPLEIALSSGKGVIVSNLGDPQCQPDLFDVEEEEEDEQGKSQASV